MSQRPDRVSGGRESATSTAQREKEAQRPPQAHSLRRGGGTRFGRADDAEGSSSQEGASQIVDPTANAVSATAITSSRGVSASIFLASVSAASL